mgnify:CR=1 FL=1
MTPFSLPVINIWSPDKDSTCGLASLYAGEAMFAEGSVVDNVSPECTVAPFRHELAQVWTRVLNVAAWAGGARPELRGFASCARRRDLAAVAVTKATTR